MLKNVLYGTLGVLGATAAFAQTGAQLVFQQLNPELPPSGPTAISGDGNTAVVAAGEEWIFTRSGGTFSKQGPTIAGPSSSIAISADGNTVLAGGASDNANHGAAWVYVRNNGVWSQQGASFFLPTEFTQSPV